MELADSLAGVAQHAAPDNASINDWCVHDGLSSYRVRAPNDWSQPTISAHTGADCTAPLAFIRQESDGEARLPMTMYCVTSSINPGNERRGAVDR